MLFGGYGDKIVYGALSLDGRGLKSYGAYALVLREVAVARRSSILCDNGFDFVERHKLRPGDQIPLGYRSAWDNKHELAVAKVEQIFDSNTQDADFPRILMFQGVNRSQDDFMEVHIYGTFDHDAIESVAGPSNLGSDADKAVVAVLKELITRSNKGWIEA
jgi:hypothetical protein